jgi:hypothetical protein
MYLIVNSDIFLRFNDGIKGGNKMETKVKVYNCPDDTEQYIVARLSNGELWFWGSYEDESEAIEVADSFENGLVVMRNG